MNVITVSLLTRARGPSELSYFSPVSPTLGSVVTVPLRGKPVRALVVKVTGASELKATLKASHFSLVKLKTGQESIVLPAKFVLAAGKVADWFAVPLGLIIYRLVPAIILKSGRPFSGSEIAANIERRANSPHHKDFVRPFLDFKIVAQIMTKELGWEFAKKETRPDPKTKIEIIDLEQKPDLTKLVNGRTFFYSTRKGLAPIVTCRDCGMVVTCTKCDTPVVLHDINNKRFYLCHKCGARSEPKDVCGHCGSWRLSLGGHGTEKLEMELKDFKPIVIDKDNIKSKKIIKEKVERFLKSSDDVLIGTELVVPYLNKKVETVIVTGADSLLALPDYQINERLLERLTNLTHLGKKLIVITRNYDSPVFQALTSGNHKKFRSQELKEREKYGYPPFTVLVKITFLGPLDKIKKDTLNLANRLKSQVPNILTHIFPGSPSRLGRYSRINLILKIPRQEWPIAEVVELLRSLPPNITIDVEPENLF